ncbi:MAG: TetR family transcriptional regulator [Propionibacteriaceae bacterium]|jgi:AcrR family transcriptional regulator|nr:TetR family transcriptional regulator [Propionibacteriaceae bacterium]
MAITRDAIVDAAVTILNRDGVERLSMRSLAQELSIKAASLYWHFANKEELYGAIAESLCAPWPLLLTPDPRQRLVDIFTAFRAALLTVRDATVITAESTPSTPRRIAVIQAIVQALEEMGVPLGHLLVVANLLNNYVLSFVADETRVKRRTPEERAEIAARLGFDGIPGDDFSFDGEFRYGLQVILAGLDAVGLDVEASGARERGVSTISPPLEW